jgi:hypothetical protein
MLVTDLNFASPCGVFFSASAGSITGGTRDL